MSLKRRDGFLGEKQINVPVSLVDKFLKNQNFLNTLYITHIGFFPKAFFHYRERKKGCPDNILFYCLDGKGYYNVLSDDFELNANQFAIFPANPPHHLDRKRVVLGKSVAVGVVFGVSGSIQIIINNAETSYKKN